MSTHATPPAKTPAAPAAEPVQGYDPVALAESLAKAAEKGAKLMGEFANPLWAKIVGYSICSVIASLNVALLFQVLGIGWMAVLVGIAVAFTLWVRFVYKGA